MIDRAIWLSDHHIHACQELLHIRTQLRVAADRHLGGAALTLTDRLSPMTRVRERQRIEHPSLVILR